MNIYQKQAILSLLNFALESVPSSLFRWLGEATNLKMHDASFYAHQQDDIPYEWFCDWCDATYECEYQDQLDSCDAQVHHIGNSSSFYYLPTDNSIFYLYGREDFTDATEETRRLYVFESFLTYHHNIDFDIEEDMKNDKFVNVLALRKFMDNEDLDYEGLLDAHPILNSQPEMLAEEFRAFCHDTFSGMNEMYDYLEDFKQNQVAYFKEYIKYRLEEENIC